MLEPGRRLLLIHVRQGRLMELILRWTFLCLLSPVLLSPVRLAVQRASLSVVLEFTTRVVWVLVNS
jgi:hypothetical protein